MLLAGCIDGFCEGRIDLAISIFVLEREFENILSVRADLCSDGLYQFICDEEAAFNFTSNGPDEFDRSAFVPYDEVLSQNLHEHQHEVGINRGIDAASIDRADSIASADAEAKPDMEFFEVS